MAKNTHVSQTTHCVQAALGAMVAIALLLVFLAVTRTQAAPLLSTGDNPKIRLITMTATLPHYDPADSDGIAKTVYFSNSTSGVITMTFDISGTQTLTLTAGAAFDELERVYTSSSQAWVQPITYTVESTHASQYNIAYTATNTNSVQTTVAITYVRDITAPTANIAYPPAGRYISGTQLVVTGTAQDNGGGCGVKRVQVSTGTTWVTATGANSWIYTWTLPQDDNIPYTISARAQDNLNIWEQIWPTVVITVDTVAPTATMPLPSHDPWVTSTIVYTWDKSTDGAGIAGYQANITNTNGYIATFSVSNPTLAFTQAFSEGVSYYARVRARDNNGNTGSWSSVSTVVTPDLTIPGVTTPSIIKNGSHLYVTGTHLYYTNTMSLAETFAVKGYSSDSLSGVGRVKFSPAFGENPGDETSNFTPWQSSAYGVDSSNTAGGVITATVYDKAGNTTIQTYTYELDGTPPYTGSVLINNGATYVTQTRVALAISAADSDCSVAEMCLNNTGTTCTDWETFTTVRLWDLDNNDGLKTVYAWFRDYLNNVSKAYSDTIILDRQPPVNTTITAPDHISATKFTVSWSADGAITYTIAYSYTANPTWINWLTGVSTKEAEFHAPAANTNYTFRVTAYDQAGNYAYATTVTRVGKFYIYLPLTLRQWVAWYQYDTYEPNNTREESYGPLNSGQNYYSHIYNKSDQKDYYYLTTASTGSIVVDLAIPVCCDYDLYLYDSLTGNFVAASNYMGKGLDEHMTYNSAQAGATYYILVYSPYQDHSDQVQYQLRAIFP